MKKLIIYFLLFIYILDTKAVRSIKKEIFPPSNIQYIIENYIENGDRSTEIGIAIHKDNLDSDIKNYLLFSFMEADGEVVISSKMLGNVSIMQIRALLQ